MGKPIGSPGGGNGRGNKDTGPQTDPHMGTESADVMNCGDDDDVVFALAGDDMILGGRGDDTMDGGEGSDTYMITGFEDADVIQDSGTEGYDMVAAGADGTIMCLNGFGPGSGVEEISAYGYDGVNIRGTGDSDLLDFSQTVLTDIAYVHGMNGHDTIIGSQGDDEIYGGLGDDVIDGQGGDDRLVGGYGEDEMTGGAGADTFVLLGITAPGDTITDFTSGEDVIDMTSITGNSGYVSHELVGIKGGQDTVIRVTLESGDTNDIAVLEGVSADSLGASDFLV